MQVTLDDARANVSVHINSFVAQTGSSELLRCLASDAGIEIGSIPCFNVTSLCCVVRASYCELALTLWVDT